MRLAGQDIGVGLVTANAREAARFYRDVLGFATDGTVQSLDGWKQQALYAGRNRLDLLEPEVPPPAFDSHVYAANGIRVLAVLVDDLDRVLAAIRSRGRRVAETTDLPGRLRITFAKDADGNVLELIGLAEPAGPDAGRLQVGLTVQDSEASRRFYGDVLGLPEQPAIRMPQGITRHAFSAGRTTIKFWSTDDPKPTRSGPPERALGLRFLRFEVESVEATRAHLHARGIESSDAPRWLRSDGRDFAVCCDPDANWLLLRD